MRKRKKTKTGKVTFYHFYEILKYIISEYKFFQVIKKTTVQKVRLALVVNSDSVSFS